MDLKIFVVVCFLSVSSILAQHDHHNHEEHKVNVAVYYESLCPDSRKFFNTQLYPALQGNLSKYINLTLVPFGKSEANFVQTQYEFKCHHGEAECYGNKIQACALHLIENAQKTEGLGYNKVTTDFINCLMEKTVRNGAEATFPTKECAEDKSVNVLSQIENCANHTDGSNYLANLGKLTDAVQKPLKSVPTIVFNKLYKEEDSALAQGNFIKAICQYIYEDKPAECSASGVDSIKITSTFVLITSVLAFYF